MENISEVARFICIFDRSVHSYARVACAHDVRRLWRRVVRRRMLHCVVGEMGRR